MTTTHVLNHSEIENLVGHYIEALTGFAAQIKFTVENGKVSATGSQLKVRSEVAPELHEALRKFFASDVVTES